MSAETARLHHWDNLVVDHPSEKASRRRVIGEQVMLSRLHLARGFSVPKHSHENEQMVCVQSGRLRFEVWTKSNGEPHEFVVAAGDVLHLPANVPHLAEALEDSVVLDVFSPPSLSTGIDRERTEG